ncbi:MAG: SRPBCC family protein, partial [Alphaproteobacteria bacterium]|nr:SRPBCC family protein [Alphaproteobacteria bacterium]
MATAYYSIVLDKPAEAVWRTIRAFDHYGWAGVVGETIIEDGKAGDQVGAIRCFTGADRTIRQRLLAHSDRDR